MAELMKDLQGRPQAGTVDTRQIQRMQLKRLLEHNKERLDLGMMLIPEGRADMTQAPFNTFMETMERELADKKEQEEINRLRSVLNPQMSENAWNGPGGSPYGKTRGRTQEAWTQKMRGA